MRKLKIAAFGATNYASTEVRINYWVKALARLGHRADFYIGGMNEPDKLDDRIRGCDIVITGRTHDPRQIAMLHAARKLYGCRIVVDTDDLITDIPKYNMASQLFHNATGMVRVSLAEYAAADQIVTSTEFLRKETLPHNPQTAVIPNVVDPRAHNKAKYREKEARHRGDLRLYWGGGGGHYDDLLAISEPILQLFREFDNLKLIFGNFVPGWAAMLPANRVFHHKVSPFYVYPKLLKWFCADIAIAPLVDSPFNRSKSHIKYLDYAMAGIPGVYQNIDAYTEMGSVRDEDTGLLASTPDEWYRSMKRLLDSAALRRQISQSAYTDVTQNWCIDDWVGKYEAMLYEVMDRPIFEVEDSKRVSAAKLAEGEPISCQMSS